MYARSIVDSRLEIAQDELGFLLEYHSVSEIDDFNARLESKYQDAYASARAAGRGSGDTASAYQNSLIRSLTDKLTSDEIRFIKNERALCMCDAEYWLTRYYWIKTQTATIRFEFRAGQRVYFNVIQRLNEMGAPIELIMAKARQLGISTVTEGLIVHCVNFGHSVNAVVASADEAKTGEMSKMTFLGYDSMDWWMKVPYTRRVESNRGMIQLGGTKSGISFQHGAQMSGIGRGSTFGVYHLSELASFNNPAELVEASLFRAVHPHPDVFGVLESTAEGNSGWFHDTYWSTKTKRNAGDPTRLVSLFLPFTVGTDQYPNKTWLRTFPVPRDWKPIEETRAMIQRAEDYIQGDPELSAALGSNWKCGREQAWYWEVNYLDARAKGTQKLWLQEMPVDDREAFQSSYDNVFGREVIAEADSRRETKYHVFGIVGQSIEDRYEPDPEEMDPTANPVQVKFVNRIRDIAYKWELQPLLWQEPFNAIDEIRADDNEHMGKLFVYQEPERGYDYSIGIRTGNGIGSGDTVVAVARRGIDPQDPDVQVAEFRSDEVSHVEVYAYALAIAAYYAKFMGLPEYQMKYREPYVSMEQVESVGDSCLVQMRRMGYRRFHRMVRYDGANISKAQATRLGWYSFSWATPMMVDSFVIRVRNGWYKVNSFATIWEMDRWEQRTVGEGSKTKYIASETSSDAGLLANAMAAFCPNDVEALADRTTKRSVEGLKGKPVFDFTPTPDGLVIPVTSGYTSHNEYRFSDLQRNHRLLR